MKRFSLVVLGLLWLLSWSLTPSIFVGPSLAIAAGKTELLDLNTATAVNSRRSLGSGTSTQRRSSRGVRTGRRMS